LNIDRDFSWLDKRSQQALDIERFRWFSAGYIAVDSSDESRIIDIRYSLLPHKIRALWGIELKQSRSDDEHVSYYTEHKDSRSSMSQLIAMIKGDELITRNNEKSIK
ncbi:MAG: inner membrane protein, partial [Flavobacteriales bacterium]